MEEIEALRKKLEARNYEAALAIVNEMEEMSREAYYGTFQLVRQKTKL